MKNILSIALLICIVSTLFGQNIKFKKGIVVVDKVEMLTYEKGGTFGAIDYELSELDSNNRIIVLTQYDNGSHMDVTDDYTKIRFINSGKNLEITGGNLKNAIQLLLKNNVLKENGKLDENEIDLFIKNYDEKISDRTVRIRE